MIDLVKKYKYENIYGIMQYVYKQIDDILNQKIKAGKLGTKFDYSKSQTYLIQETIKLPDETKIPNSLGNKMYFEKTFSLYKYEKCVVINNHTIFIYANRFNKFKYDESESLINGIYGIMLVISPESIYNYNI